ncbi:hypothetical protein [Metasolibacillus sp.]|uniref:structural cement protein Gp24 n=1 Tax=Metasolibacillus sp. TaxID=2703680 RepID=UPI0025DF64F1|nr:hypothetical protein [Metasolibacillus sp.]MCT6926158.1 hypothetical protein [Metasolibacillus sp.]MCT6942409.1 hypothetical protein [Metasolibacillus sp.]
MAITEYGQYMPIAGKPGQLANYQEYAADSYPAKEIIPFGAAVQLSADGTGVELVKTGGTPIGIALAREIHDYTTNADDQKYLAGQPVPVVKRGNIFVVAGGDVTNGAAVQVDATTGNFVTSGGIAFGRAVFRTNATADSLVQIEVNLP